MDLYKEIENIATKEDFLRFMELLIDNFRNNPDDWENKSLENYLESIQSWVEDMDGYYKNNNIQTPESISWNFFANVLYAAKIYE
jgi:hypothetical protein